VTFQDPQLQRCYDTHLGEVGNTLENLGEVHSLIATHDYFVALEGNHSARVHETIDCLLSAPMRPSLRLWYGRAAVPMDSTALEFRNLLSRLTGERLDTTPEISLNLT
jgi:hypothetical protein